MIRGVHAMFYTSEPEAARAVLRDKLGLPAHDVGDGWLIFDVPEGEVGCHPADAPKHGVSFYCDDIEATIADLRAKDVPIKQEIEDRGWGRCAVIELPGGVAVEVYQPRYEKSSRINSPGALAPPVSGGAQTDPGEASSSSRGHSR